MMVERHEKTDSILMKTERINVEILLQRYCLGTDNSNSI